MKAPHAHTLYMNKIRDVNSSLDLKELEFVDKRNTAKMHTEKRKKYFNKGKPLSVFYNVVKHIF